jgi:hypothetical protein
MESNNPRVIADLILGGRAVLQNNRNRHCVRDLIGNTDVPLQQLWVMIMGSVWSIIINPLEILANRAYPDGEVLLREIALFR